MGGQGFQFRKRWKVITIISTQIPGIYRFSIMEGRVYVYIAYVDEKFFHKFLNKNQGRLTRIVDFNI